MRSKTFSMIFLLAGFIIAGYFLTAPLQPLLAFEGNSDQIKRLRRKLQGTDFKLEVSEVGGTVTIVTEEDTEPREVEVGDILRENTTIDAETGNISLTVPGISHMDIDTGSQLEINKLNSSEKEGTTQNEINLEMYKGGIKTRQRSREDMETNFQLETPTSVAGVRGTVFQCDVESDGATACSVLTGSLNFSSRLRPERSRVLKTRQRSSMQSDQQSPSEPEEIDEEQEEDLSEFQERADRQVLLKPYAGGFELNGEEFEETGEGVYKVRKEYQEKRSLVFSGIAGVKEEEAELEKIKVIVNSDELDVNGLEEWQTNLDVEPPEEGEKIVINGRIRAHDSLESSSRKFPFQVTLFNPERKGMVPADLQEGEVPVNVSDIAGIPLREITFPFHLSGDQVGDEQIVISGSVETEKKVKGVAYRLTGEEEWKEAEGDEAWSLVLPGDEDDVFEIEIIAWTEESIGQKVTLGPLEYTVEPPFPPFNYRKGNVPVELTLVAGNQYDEIEFPYHTYKPDLESGEIVLEGTVETEAPVKGVAYKIGGQDWQQATDEPNWRIALPAESEITYDELQIVAWTQNGVIGEIYEPGAIKHENLSYNNILRREIDEMFRDFENENLREFTGYLNQDFYYQDAQTGRQKGYYDFRRFLRDFFSEVRSLSVFYEIDQLIAGQNGGEINYKLEWRGVDYNSNRPFIMAASDVSNNYIRNVDGQFELQSFRDFPLHMFVFHRENIYIPDLGSISIEDLQTSASRDQGDIIAETTDPAMFVNTLSVGGEVESGGIKRLRAADFSGVGSISSSLSGYDNEVGIAVGEMFGVNIVKSWGDHLTALVKVIDIRSDRVQVRVISGRDLVDGLDNPVFSYRRVNPFE